MTSIRATLGVSNNVWTYAVLPIGFTTLNYMLMRAFPHIFMNIYVYWTLNPEQRKQWKEHPENNLVIL